MKDWPFFFLMFILFCAAGTACVFLIALDDACIMKGGVLVHGIGAYSCVKAEVITP